MKQQIFLQGGKRTDQGSCERAETNTSGEIRVHIDNHCKEDVMDRAAWWFAKLEMHKTEQRNGVLFYLAVKDKSLPSWAMRDQCRDSRRFLGQY